MNIKKRIEKNYKFSEKLKKQGKTYDDYLLEKKTKGKFKTFKELENYLKTQKENK